MFKSTRQDLVLQARYEFSCLRHTSTHPLMEVVIALMTYHCPTKLHMWTALKLMRFIRAHRNQVG